VADTQLHNLLHKEVTRKEFLGILGLALCSILGFGHVLEFFGALSGKHHGSQKAGHNNNYGGGQD
jgi:hypothetical protein